MKYSEMFATSDWHLGHAKSIVFDKRPFRDLDHMHQSLINNYNKTVPTNGICYFLGDMGMLGPEAMRAIISQLNGLKVLVLGNHDKGVLSMHNHGFDLVLYGAVTQIQGQRLTMSHCPLKGLYREPTDHFLKEEHRGLNWHGEHKNDAYTFSNEGQFHLHGHIHSGPAAEGKETILGRQMDIGAPGNKYRPVSFSHIESWIMRTLLAEAQNANKSTV